MGKVVIKNENGKVIVNEEDLELCIRENAIADLKAINGKCNISLDELNSDQEKYLDDLEFNYPRGLDDSNLSGIIPISNIDSFGEENEIYYDEENGFTDVCPANGDYEYGEDNKVYSLDTGDNNHMIFGYDEYSNKIDIDIQNEIELESNIYGNTSLIKSDECIFIVKSSNYQGEGGYLSIEEEFDNYEDLLENSEMDLSGNEQVVLEAAKQKEMKEPIKKGSFPDYIKSLDERLNKINQRADAINEKLDNDFSDIEDMINGMDKSSEKEDTKTTAKKHKR